MMRSISRLLRTRASRRRDYSSVLWRDSRTFAGVRFGIRRASLQQRIELTTRVRELLHRHEFLRSGDQLDSTEAHLAELLSERLYIEWGLAALEGLSVDGEPATVQKLIDAGPDMLAKEVLEAIRQETELNAEEAKNS